MRYLSISGGFEILDFGVFITIHKAIFWRCEMGNQDERWFPALQCPQCQIFLL
ncbi:MAG: hypothetical protein ACFFCI_10275 [Promethearchaeota archaeon]